MKHCSTCTREAGNPFRSYSPEGKIVMGCIDAFHNGHLVTPSESARWHNRPEAKKHRTKVAFHLKSLNRKRTA